MSTKPGKRYNGGLMRWAQKLGAGAKRRPLFIALTAFFAVLLVVSATMIILDSMQASRARVELQHLAAQAGSPGPSPTSAGPPALLPQYRDLYAQNKDLTGWIKIDGTAVDYPVMFSPYDGDFYLDHGFNKEKSKSGVPFIDERCTIDPFGTNTIIYGHHMKDGSMFASLLNYEDQDFYKSHPSIQFSTLYEHREYQIIAVFKSKTYYTTDKAFKHYNFLNAKNEADFNDYISHIKALSLYDTGVSAKYGDALITLITCSYHTENGQFVVVAKKVQEPASQPSPTP